MTTVYSILAAVLLAIAAIPPALAGDTLSQRIAACTREQDDARRLACFDRAAASSAAAKQVDATQDFGVHGSELARNRDDDDPKDSTPKRIGDAVEIIAGTLGSHKLVVASRATAVTRVR